MKKISTLLLCSFLALAATKAEAQVTENFTSNPQSDCFTYPGATYGSGALTLANSTNATITTPYINFTGTTSTVSFKTTYSNSLGNGKYRRFTISLVTVDGTVAKTSGTINLPASGTLVSYNFTGLTANSTYKVVIAYTTDGGQPNAIAFDDLSITNANYYYGGNHCNTAPTALANVYASDIPNQTQITGNIITNDTDPNGETLSVVNPGSIVLSDPTMGTITVAADGAFTFTPSASYYAKRNNQATFSYSIIDNGFPNTTSTSAATVTFSYTGAGQAPLPVRLISFAGNAVNGKAKLTWKVADNETGSYFEIEKSADARSFVSAARIENNKKAGEETYTFTDATPLSKTTFYRLRMVNNDGSVVFSRYLPVHVEGAAVKSIVLLKNPVYNNLEFTFAADNAGIYTVNVYTAAGAKAYSTKTTLLKGSNNVALSIGNALNSGAYIVEVTNGAASVTAKFFKQ